LENAFHRHVPSNPRCKFCSSPFGGFGGALFGLFGRRPWTKNPSICNVCQIYAEKHPGGAEVNLTLLFADVRGSTSLAEGMSPTEFKRLLDRFYKTATDVLMDYYAWIDKFVGDEVVAFFFSGTPGGQNHATLGMNAARDLLKATANDSLPIGIGVHAGRAYVGTVGGEHVVDVTAVGDDVNVAARLASAAEPRSIFASESTCVAAGLSLDDASARDLDLKGKSAPVRVRVLR
jgi:adenylate cyclase